MEMPSTALQAPSYPFLGKVISVTGAGSGIAQATARLLYARGATVALADINPNALEGTAKLLREYPAQQGQLISTRVVDVTKEDDCFGVSSGSRLQIHTMPPAPLTLRFGPVIFSRIFFHDGTFH